MVELIATYLMASAAEDSLSEAISSDIANGQLTLMEAINQVDPSQTESIIALTKFPFFNGFMEGMSVCDRYNASKYMLNKRQTQLRVINSLSPIFVREMQKCCPSSQCTACMNYFSIVEDQISALIMILKKYINDLSIYISKLEKNDNASVTNCPARPTGRGKFRHSSRTEISEFDAESSLQTITGGGRKTSRTGGGGKDTAREESAPLLVTLMAKPDGRSSADVVYVDPKRKRKDHLVTIAMATGVLLAGGLAIGIISKRM